LIPPYAKRATNALQAEALLLSLKIPCAGTVFEGKDAWSTLLGFVEAYFFDSFAGAAPEHGIHVTSQMPILLQRPRHSVTVVGIERLRSGKRRLLIFDPAWRPPSMDSRTLGETNSLSFKELLALRRYSKSERYLKRFAAFEIVGIGITE
jgi:hypothetical protein